MARRQKQLGNPPRTMAVQFPIGGVSRSVAYQAQAPFTMPDALNVRPDDVLLRRRRGGSRPGLGLFNPVQMGSGNPVRLLSYVTLGGTFVYVLDPSFAGGAWETNAYMTGGLPTALSKRGGVKSGGTDDVKYGGVIRSTGIVASSPYAIELVTVPDPTTGTYIANGSRYGILARMDNTTPAPGTSGLEARLDLINAGSTTTATWSLIVNGSSVANGSTSSLPTRGAEMRLTITTNSVSLYWGSTVLKSAQAIAAHSGQTAIGYYLEAIGDVV